MYEDNKDSEDKNYENIIRQILNGDTDLYKEIVADYKNNIFAVVYSMIHSYHTAEDITQDVFIDGYLKLNSLSGYDKIGGWLAQIARNKCVNYINREAVKYRRQCELDEFIPDTQTQTPESYIINRYENENLEKAVKNLPESQKNVTVLFYFENYSQKKIADILHIPEGTVKRRLHDARLNLKKELDNMNTNTPTKETKLLNDTEFEEKVMVTINNLLPRMDDKDFVNTMDEEIEKFGKNKNALGMLYYWRGASQVTGDKPDLNGAKKSFEKAFEYINDNNKYKGAALSGIKIVNSIETDKEKYVSEPKQVKMSVAGEVYKEYDNKIDWLCNPSWNTGGFTCPQVAYHQIYLWAAIVNKHFFDLNLSFGETQTDENNGAIMTLVSKDETVTVLAGTFGNCLHINFKIQNINRDVWYAKDVGLIKFHDDGADNDGVAVNYELCKYKINGGSGYMPFAVSNLWNYKSTGIDEEEIYQFNEYEVVSITEKPDGKYINTSAIDCYKLRRKNV